MDIGKKIASLRKTKAVTQTQLADYLSVTPQTVSRWEANNGVPDIYLLPKIATFFDVSIEELYGINNREKVTNLVYKYSIFRDEKSYEESMSLIESNLNNSPDDEYYQFLLAQKMHMYLQKSREYLNKADAVADELIAKTSIEDAEWYMVARLQKTQFDVLQGRGAETFKRLKDNFEADASLENTMLYMCVLLEMFKYKELLALHECKAVQELISKDSTVAANIYGLLFAAANEDENLQFYESHFADYEKIADPSSVLQARIGYARVLKAHDKQDAVDRCKEKMLGEVAIHKENEALFNMLVEKIRAL